MGTGPTGRNFTSEFTIVRGNFIAPSNLGAAGTGTLVVGGLRHVFFIAISAGTTGFVVTTTSGLATQGTTSGFTPAFAPTASVGYQVLAPGLSGVALGALASGSAQVSGQTFYYQALGD